MTSLLTLLSIFLFGMMPPANDTDPIRVLYVTGGGYHDYAAQEELLRSELTSRLNLEWTTDFEAGSSNDHQLTLHNNPNWHENFDAVIYNMCFASVEDVDYIEGITTAHYESGTAAVFLHCAMHTYRDSETDQYDKLVGLSTYHHERRQREFHIEPVEPDHPVMAGFPEEGWVSPRDELYIVTHEYDNLIPLAHAYGPETETHHVVMWVNTFGNARIVGTTAGHNTDVIADPVYLNFLENGLKWAVDR